MHDQKSQYFGKNNIVSMEEMYGPKINNQCENMSGEHETKKKYFLSEGCKCRNASHKPDFCINVWITESLFERAMIFWEDLSRTGDKTVKIFSQNKWVSMYIRNTI